MEKGKIVQVMGPVVDVELDCRVKRQKACYGSGTAYRKSYGALYYAGFQ